jgi:uncharacterized protein YjbI with pentapeptide repeats
MTTDSNTSRTRTGLISRLRQYWKENEWVYLVVGLAIGLLIPYLFQSIQADAINDFLLNLVPEAMGIFFTVLIIDRLDSIREEQVIKDQLVRRLQSRYNHTALQAVEELRVMGYLENGTLRDRNLRGANWVDANMYMADLRGSDLGNGVLDRADFVLANLEGVNVTDEQFAKSDTMHGAIMPDGRKYDGRYQLPGDFVYARRKDINLESDEAMAAWFGVSLEHYHEGQRWADEHLAELREKASSD